MKAVWHSGILLFFVAVLGCAAMKTPMEFASGSVKPGTSVTFKGTGHDLLGEPIAPGDPLPSTSLVDAGTLKTVDLSAEKGSVLFLSIVASLDTKVCEEQTHYLGEQGDRLPREIRRIVISRDLPFAQERFAREAGLQDLQYLSDYKTGSFGKATGLLVDDLMLLARTLMIVDRQGIVRYIQVVPEMTQLPDMEKAFQAAERLSKMK